MFKNIFNRTSLKIVLIWIFSISLSLYPYLKKMLARYAEAYHRFGPPLKKVGDHQSNQHL